MENSHLEDQEEGGRTENEFLDTFIILYSVWCIGDFSKPQTWSLYILLI
jgi:hypothetical protein